MEDLLHGIPVELFPDRRLVSATASLLRPPDGSTNCGIADAAIYQARPKVPPFVSQSNGFSNFPVWSVIFSSSF
jgi:hypothetical protein